MMESLMMDERRVPADAARLKRLVERGVLSRLHAYDYEDFPEIREAYALLIDRAADSLNEETVRAISILLKDMTTLSDQLERTRREVRQLKSSVEDGGTANVTNHHTFRGALARSIAYAARYQTSNCLLWFDVEGLDAINHHFGTEAGDAVLARVRDQLSDHVRASDLVGRMRSDEFAVILANADLDAAASKGRMLARQIGRDGLKWEDRHIEISISFGVHELMPHDTPESAVSQAEDSLYRRKRLRMQYRPALEGTVLPFAKPVADRAIANSNKP